MPIICPAILAKEPHDYREQMERVEPFAERVQIDLTDQDFAPSKTVELEQIWWPDGVLADVHLMYRQPMDHLDMLIKLKPHMVIIHNEADVHHMHFAAELHKHDIKTGLALLKETPVDYAKQIMHSFDHVMIFAGDLGYFGGQADLGLLDKVKQIKIHHPEVEIGWDGGVNDQNAKQLAEGGVDVLNVGGFVQKAEKPKESYDLLKQLVASQA